MRRRAQLRGSFDTALIRLILCLFIGFVIECVQPRSVPPGNVWSFGDTLAASIVLLGAWWTGRRYYEPLLFLLYGILGGHFVGFMFLPDSRDYIGMIMGRSSPASFVSTYCACVVLFGFACRALGKLARVRNEWRDFDGDPTVCETCGYLLYGLPQNRCPECGEPFDTPIPTPPATPPENRNVE